MIAQDHLNGRRVFFYFMAFFSVIATVNGIMATLAVRTHTGLVTTHAYEKGLAYNEVISAEEKQQALGWHAGITFKDNTLIVELRDAKGKTILPTRLTAIFTRPTQAGMDFRQDLQPGANTISFPTPGLWNVRILAEKDGEQFQESRRIVAP